MNGFLKIYDSQVLQWWLFICFFLLFPMHCISTQSDTECYTANGADYLGTQSHIESSLLNPVRLTSCVKWSETGMSEFITLPENYCRNSNNSIFPWCFIRKGNKLVSSLCDIPNCKSPAYAGCYRIPAVLSNLNHTALSGSQYILNGNESIQYNADKRIENCLGFCRKLKYISAGLAGDRSCYCGSWANEMERDAVLANRLNKLPEKDCRATHCVNDPGRSCGGVRAMAVYDTKAGMCGTQFWKVEHGTIYSPSWPGAYVNHTCSWKVFLPHRVMHQRSKHTVVFSFIYFELDKLQEKLSFFTFQYFASSKPHLVAAVHGGTVPNDLIISLQNVTYIFVHFITDDKNVLNGGFVLQFRVENATKTKPNQENATANYGNDVSISWRDTTMTPTRGSQATDSSGSAIVIDGTGLSSVIAGIIVGFIIITILIIITVLTKRSGTKKVFDTKPSSFSNPVSFRNDDIKAVTVC
ncbi:unnamed protein product [Clavelina lepadiformis]|uniref:Kringle-containing protein marking the eye and the nose n=1 Tax=Clavelina lepadiformis TaxID=159417 RepID=A0ABP0GL13_CLALP